MVTLTNIEKHELRDLVLLSYENDEELFEKYHIEKFGLMECVDKTMEMIEQEQDGLDKPLVYFKVLCDGLPIGYVVTFDNILYSFAISMEYRKKEVLLDWWERVAEVLGAQFYAILYANNVRACDFLRKQNMRVINQENNFLIFSNN